MDAIQLQQYLHDHIPLSKAMGITVTAIGARDVTLSAPLRPNINHRETVFGGSASALALLAAWSLLHVRLTDAGMNARVVVQRNTIEYERPMAGDFAATSEVSGETWQRFVTMLQRRGRARISLAVTLRCGGEIGGRLDGEFVAFKAP